MSPAACFEDSDFTPANAVSEPQPGTSASFSGASSLASTSGHAATHGASEASVGDGGSGTTTAPATSTALATSTGTMLDPCEGVTCSGHGVCVERGGEPACACERDWHPVGLECIADGAYGDACEGDDTCTSGWCVEHICSVPCDPFDVGHCQALGVGGICVPLLASSGGACRGAQDTGTDGDDDVLELGATFLREIDPLSDRDLFAVVIPASGAYVITVEPVADLDPRVGLFEGGDSISTYDAHGSGVAESISLDAPSAGMLHIIVGTAGPYPGFYVVSVREQ